MGIGSVVYVIQNRIRRASACIPMLKVNDIVLVTANNRCAANIVP